jgi:hypothetical protein
MTPAPDRQALADLVRGPMGEAVLAGDAAVEPRPVPGLPDGSVWEVSILSNPHMPRLAVGRGPGERLRLLTGSPDAFQDLVADLPVTISDTQTALGYVRGFLAATRPHDVLLQVATRPEDIAWRPGSPEEEERRAEFLADTSLTPRAEPNGDSYLVSLILLRNQHAQRSNFRVSPDGSIGVEDELLVEGLPLPVLR